MSSIRSAPPSDVLQVGYLLADDYEIVSLLGTGGFGNTYLARDIPLSRDVAIKEYFPREIAHRHASLAVRAKNDQFSSSFKWGLERFVQEARLLARFRHPNIVRVFRTFDANESAYIIIDYVHGQDLDTWLDGHGRRPTQDEMDELLAPLVDALVLVHAAGVLHRDIKPANIRVREETSEPVLLDFGASKQSISELTRTTMAIISRGYSPYEAYAADSGAQGPWTDIYALGATVYRALTDQAPPEATERLLDDQIVPLKAQHFPGFRQEFLAAVDWALSVRPNQRPQSVDVWREQLFSGGDATIVNWKTTRSLTLRPSETSDLAGRLSETTGSQLRSRTASAAMPPAAATKRSPSYLGVLATVVLIVAAGAVGLLAAVETGTVRNEWVASIINQIRRSTNTDLQRVTAMPGGQAKPEQQVPSADTAPGTPLPTPSAAIEGKPGAVTMPTPAASAELPRPTQAIPPTPVSVGPEYAVFAFGGDGDADRVAVAAVSNDGQRIASGGSDGSLRYWSTSSGEEKLIGRPNGNAVLALEFIGSGDRSVAAAFADGSIGLGDLASSKVVTLGRTALERGFVRAINYDASTRDLVAVETNASETKLSRWSIDGGTGAPTATFSLGSYMVRAAAISRQTGNIVVATDHEALLAYDARDGSIKETLSWINEAPDWTTSIALTPDARILARGGLYPQVEIFDLDGKNRKAVIPLGEHAQTVWLAFSPDGHRLAIAYSGVKDRMARHRILVVDGATGQPINDVEAPKNRRRWVSFMPSTRNAYWLASTSDGQVRLCDTSAVCRMTGAMP